MPEQSVLKRADFIRRFVDQGLTYSQADLAYQAMIGFFEDGVAGKCRICVAPVGVLKPVIQPARPVTMGFERDASGVHKRKRTYLLGMRWRYVFKVYRKFGRKHGLLP
jgi:hypothetical protein